MFTGITLTVGENGNFTNTSSNMVGGFADMTGLAPIVLVVLYGAIVFAAAAFITGNYQRYKTLVRVVSLVSGTFEYFVKGIGSTAAVAVTFAPLYLFTRADGETRGWVLGAVVVMAVGYIVLAAVGYVADRIYQRAKQHHKRHQFEEVDA